jgi:RNA-directed DNA polymerase
MIHGREKSDSAIVATKLTNTADTIVHAQHDDGKAVEPVEPRAGTKRNADEQSTLRAQDRDRVSQALGRIRQVARQRKKERFTALLHHISVDCLRMAFFALKRDAAPGVDGLMWRTYEADLDQNLTDLHERVHRGAYRTLPSRRTHIPKADGRVRPLAIAALEDKIVQRATVAVLNAIYEEDLLGFSYGFRPKRGQHDALDALAVGIGSKRVNFIFDADIATFFDSVSKEKLIRFVEHRVGDPRIIRLIQKWLKAGILEDGVVTVSETGMGQGSVISPLLANIYLHYTFDLWAERWRRREATGDMIIVRYADDIIVGFEHEDDAQRFLDAMRERLQEFSLSLNPGKTRLIEFGRHAAVRRAQRGLGKPETFTFLGFVHICGQSRRGRFLLKRRSRRDRAQRNQGGTATQMHRPIPDQGRWLAQVTKGYFAYHAVPTNLAALRVFRFCVTRLWHHTLRRRSQKDRYTWERMAKLVGDYLPKPQILHPWPNVRFAVRYSR